MSGYRFLKCISNEVRYQVVWEGSKEVNCGQASQPGSVFTCQYYPPGNYIRRMAQFVKRLKDEESFADDSFKKRIINEILGRDSKKDYMNSYDEKSKKIYKSEDI